MASNTFSIPQNAVDTQQASCSLLVPFVGYELRFFNPLLEELGEVSHFILVAALGGQVLPDFLPKLGLTSVQLQNLLQRLQQLNLLDARLQLTQEGQATATFLNQGWQGKTIRLWFEQTYKPGAMRQQPLILTEANPLQTREQWPSSWPERPLFTGRSSTQMQSQALQAWIQQQAKHLQTKGDRVKQAHQALWTQLFPQARDFVAHYPQWTLSIELQPLEQQEVRYYALTLPLPGDSPLWCSARAENNKEAVYLRPWVQARVTYTPASGLPKATAAKIQPWQHHWCALTGRSLAMETQPPEAGATLPGKVLDWQARLAALMPEENTTQKLMNREIAFASGQTPWQLDEQRLHQQLKQALAGACLTL